MKKRVLCLLLSVVMLVACLTGCSKKNATSAIEDVNEEASESTLTLAMYLLCEKDISEEQQEKISEAVNKITKSKFKTQLVLKFYTADEYYTELEKAFAARAEAKAAGLINTTPVTTEESTEEETVMNEYGFTELAYPEIADYQVDIFYVGGYEKFDKYMDMSMLQNLNDELSINSKKLNNYIATPYLKYMKEVNNGVYAIPANTVIGEYTYMLLNKQALADYGLNSDTGLKYFSYINDSDLANFLKNIKDHSSDKYLPLYTNLTNTELASTGVTVTEDDKGNKFNSSVNFWGIGADGQLSNDFSVLASNYTVNAKYGSSSSYMPKMEGFLNTVFSTQFDCIMDYRRNGYFAEDMSVDGKDAAVMYLKGNINDIEKYTDDYEVVVIKNPTLDTKTLYENMFAVSSYTTSVSRSMKILTYLNTNADFRNILLYGIEDENYELVPSDYVDENGVAIEVVRRLNEDYLMDTNKLGNTLIGYTLEGQDPTFKDYIMKQNRDAVASVTLGFELNYDGYFVDAEKLKALREVSLVVKEKLDTCTPETYTSVRLEINQLIDQKLINDLSSKYSTADKTDPVGIACVYDKWAKSKGVYTSPEQ